MLRSGLEQMVDGADAHREIPVDALLEPPGFHRLDLVVGVDVHFGLVERHAVSISSLP